MKKLVDMLIKSILEYGRGKKDDSFKKISEFIKDMFHDAEYEYAIVVRRRNRWDHVDYLDPKNEKESKRMLKELETRHPDDQFKIVRRIVCEWREV